MANSPGRKFLTQLRKVGEKRSVKVRKAGHTQIAGILAFTNWFSERITIMSAVSLSFSGDAAALLNSRSLHNTNRFFHRDQMLNIYSSGLLNS